MFGGGLENLVFWTFQFLGFHVLDFRVDKYKKIRYYIYGWLFWECESEVLWHIEFALR